MKATILATVLLCTFIKPIFSQIEPTSASNREQAFGKRKHLDEISLAKSIQFESIGPTVMSGRVVDLEVNPNNPNVFYVAYASGGLWKTVNNGQSFTPIFDQQAVMTIGDIAVDWKNNKIWVGTGENNSSRSSYSGNGIYMSIDDGKTWEHKGLNDSQHIGRIILDPNDKNKALVAVIGHLYTDNDERGVFKTADGGNTWQKVLFVNEKTGAIDLIIDPDNNNNLWAATWQRDRKAYSFTESGIGSGIYSSVDGGNSWQSISTPASGFPIGEGCGRIGLSISRKNNKTYLYAIVDNQAKRPTDKKEEKSDLLTKADFRNMTKEQFLALPSKKLKKFLRSSGFPQKYSADKLTQLIKSDKFKPSAIADFLEDANSALFTSDQPIFGAELYTSEDNGKTWLKTNEKNMDGLFYSYGYYFGQIRTSYKNPERVFTMGVPIIMSENGGKTWKSIDGDNVHGDFHALWLNPADNGHIICGNDGGVNISYDYGKHWIKCNSPAVGQFYSINYDMAEPFNVYGGLQDNGVWVGSSQSSESTEWHGSGEYNFKSIMGGDGMQVAVDQRDNETIYTGFQFGNYFKVNRRKEGQKFISPTHELGERPLRFNWQTPISLSSFNQDILYFGANKLYRSMNQGKSWEAISDDLTNGGKPGDVPFGTITTFHESPLKFGVIITGSDDGKVNITKDGGDNWIDISSGLPAGLWVSRVLASAHNKSRIYVSLNGYRNDHFTSYVFTSEDFGKTWVRIGLDLPIEPVNVVKEDPVNENILYVGTDHGVYVTLDRGTTFMGLNHSLPGVAIHDLFVHPRDHKLVLGTHGRSLYITNVNELQQLTAENLAKELIVFDTKPFKARNWGMQSAAWEDINTPKIKIPVYCKESDMLTLNIFDKENNLLFNKEFKTSKGLNVLEYDGTVDEKIITKYEKTLQALAKKEDGEDDIKLKKADNGFYYIKEGAYKVVVKNKTTQADNALNFE